jgi:hypothetical protein
LENFASFGRQFQKFRQKLTKIYENFQKNRLPPQFFENLSENLENFSKNF